MTEIPLRFAAPAPGIAFISLSHALSSVIELRALMPPLPRRKRPVDHYLAHAPASGRREVAASGVLRSLRALGRFDAEAMRRRFE
jgi:hypothetical protein